MFARSAAMDTLQGKAIHAINVKWGGASPKASNAASSNNNNNSNSRRSGSGSAVSSGEGGGILSGGGGIKAGGGQQAPGRETIGIAVCKKKYKPFQFRVLKERGGVKVAVAERLYACQCHHAARKAVIEQHGVRQGWQPFGVWSLRKAQEQARLETIRLNNNLQCVAISDTTLIKGSKKNASLTSISNDGDSSTDTEETDTEVSYSNTKVPETAILRKSLSSVCLNGACTWKVESAYDDIYKEMHGCTESEAEENESKGRQGWYM